MPKGTLEHYSTSIYYDIIKVAKYIRVVGNDIFEQITDEITCVEFTALDTISLHKDICQRDLAKLLLKDRANTGRLLDSLEAKEFIVRHNDTKNNRLVRKIEITPKGKKVLLSVTTKLEPRFRKFTEAISEEEILKLAADLKKLCSALDDTVYMEI